MNDEQNTDNDEISLIDLFAVLWHRKVMIITITLIAAIGVAIFAVVSIRLPADTSPLPNEYTPQALMLINNGNSSGGLSSMLGASGLGSLAGLAGVSTGSTSSDLAIYLVSTNTMLDMVVDEFDLIHRYKIDTPTKKAKSPRADSRKALKKKLTASYDDKSGVFSIAFTDTDPAFAQTVVNYCVAYLGTRFDELGIDKNKLQKENLERNIENSYQTIISLEEDTRNLELSVQRGGGFTIPSITMELQKIMMELEAQRQVYSQLRVQYELLKVTMDSESPVFQILELAEVPDQKSGPSRGLICIIVTFGAAFLSVFLAFIMNAIGNIRKDPEAMAKLRGEVV
jgi:uncharacterized protein involved in exopolysaccharide biosynthesis